MEAFLITIVVLFILGAITDLVKLGGWRPTQTSLGYGISVVVSTVLVVVGLYALLNWV